MLYFSLFILVIETTGNKQCNRELTGKSANIVLIFFHYGSIEVNENAFEKRCI